MVSKYHANDIYFNFQTSGDVEGLWDPIFDTSPIDSGSFTTGSPSIDGASPNTKDLAALMLQMDAMSDAGFPPFDNFAFTSNKVPVSAMGTSTKPTVSCDEPTGSPILQGQHQQANFQDLIHLNFSSYATHQPQAEEYVRIPCHAPLPSATHISKRKRESACADLKISRLGNSSPPSVEIKKQSISIEGSLQGRRGSKTTHSITERKYRENLNLKITQLQQTLLTTDYSSKEDPRLFNKVHTLNVPKPCKGDILASTIDYIQQAEIDKRHMREEIRLLRTQIAGMEKLNRCEDYLVTSQLRGLQLQVPAKA